jgi:hypothetical protein
MYGLEELHHLNEVRPAAEHHLSRYKKLLARALREKNWRRARVYDGLVQDFEKFLDGRIKVYPNRANAEDGRFIRSKGRSFAKLPGYGLKA